MSNLNTPRSRDAAATIRGFVYQVLLTIQRLITLAPNSILYLEAGEDIDEVSRTISEEDGSVQVERRLLEQVKHRASASLTLASKEALDSLAGWVELINNNQNQNLVFRYVTNAKVGNEKFPLPGNLADYGNLITLWQKIQQHQLQEPSQLNLALHTIKDFLLSCRDKNLANFNPDTWEAFVSFLEDSTQEQFSDFVQRVEWSTEQTPFNGLEAEIITLLQTQGHATSEKDARLIYYRLFHYVFNKLSQAGEKQLTLADRSLQIALELQYVSDTIFIQKLETLKPYLDQLLEEFFAAHFRQVNAQLEQILKRVPDWRDKFLTWDEISKEHNARKKHTAFSQTSFIGRQAELHQLQTFLADDKTKIIIVSGPRTIGKRRLVMEALSQKVEQVVFATEVGDVSLDDVRLLLRACFISAKLSNR